MTVSPNKTLSNGLSKHFKGNGLSHVVFGSGGGGGGGFTPPLPEVGSPFTVIVDFSLNFHLDGGTGGWGGGFCGCAMQLLLDNTYFGIANKSVEVGHQAYYWVTSGGGFRLDVGLPRSGNNLYNYGTPYWYFSLPPPEEARNNYLAGKIIWSCDPATNNATYKTHGRCLRGDGLFGREPLEDTGVWSYATFLTNTGLTLQQMSDSYYSQYKWDMYFYNIDAWVLHMIVNRKTVTFHKGLPTAGELAWYNAPITF
jgi:hypothetical protein